MSRYLTVDTFNTGTITAGASAAFERTIGYSYLNIVKIKVVPSGSSTGWKLQIFKDVARTKELFATKDQVVGSFFAPTRRNGAEALEGFVAPYEDLDGTGKIHLYVTNSDSVSRNYDIEITTEAVSLVGAGTYTAEGTAPRYIIKDTNEAADKKIWDIAGVSGDLLIRTRTDVDGAGVTALSIVRGSGTAVSYIQFGQPVVVPVGSSTDPGLAFAGATNYGWYLSGGTDPTLTVNGTAAYTFNSSTLRMLSNSAIISLGAFGDVNFVRDAANVGALKRGTVAQALRIYGTTTGPKYLSLRHDGTNAILDAAAGGDLYFQIAGVSQWKMDGAAIYPVADNSESLGDSSHRTSNIFSVLGSFSALADSSKYLQISHSGSSAILQAVGSNGVVTVSSSTGLSLIINTSPLVEIKAGTAATELRIYGTTTGPHYTFISNNASTAQIGNNSDIPFDLWVNGAARWRVNQSGSAYALAPITDDVYDIGASGARVANIYSAIGTFGTIPATSGVIRIPNDNYIYSRNAANDQNRALIGLNNTDGVEIGDSSGGGLKVYAATGKTLSFNTGSSDVDLVIKSNANANHFTSDGGAFSGKGSFEFGSVGYNAQSYIAIAPPAITQAASSNYFVVNIDPTPNAVTIPSGTTPLVGSLIIGGPNIVATGTVTVAASLIIASAPTAGSRNYAIYSIGKVNLSSLPTSSAGLSTGDLWVDTTGALNVLKVV